jgi:hypothetical protein
MWQHCTGTTVTISIHRLFLLYVQIIKLLPFHTWWMPDSTHHSRDAKLTFIFFLPLKTIILGILWVRTRNSRRLMQESDSSRKNASHIIIIHSYIGIFSWLEKVDDNCSTSNRDPLYWMFLYSRSAFLFGAVYYCILLQAGLKKSLFGYMKINHRLSIFRFMWYSPVQQTAVLRATTHTHTHTLQILTFRHRCCFKKGPLLPITDSLSDMKWNESWRVY